MFCVKRDRLCKRSHRLNDVRSRKAGFILFLSLSLSSVFIGFLTRFIACDGEDKSPAARIQADGYSEIAC